MAEICCGVVSESETSPPCKPSRPARRRRMDIRRLKVVPGTETENKNGCKRLRLELFPEAPPVSRECDNAVEHTISNYEEDHHVVKPSSVAAAAKYGAASICGRRREMEDAVAIHPSFCRMEDKDSTADKLLHYYGVYDGHGCSHVAIKCRERLHELVKEELESDEESGKTWKNAMERSFLRMEKEVIAWHKTMVGATCRCELQTPQCEAVGSTAVVAVVAPDKIIVANCGDSRAVLCRNGKALPLSIDHKPDRPDELSRIEAAGGRVIYWDGPRVLGMLAMSRAIGDNYFKPYVICDPEVTITDRTDEDDCLILASDGLWDVVSNDTACGVARMCLKGKGPASTASCSRENDVSGGNSDDACSEASLILTKLALARRSADNVSVVVIDLRKDT